LDAPVDHSVGDLTQRQVPVPGVVAHCRESLTHTHSCRGSNNSFGLFKENPGIESVLQLLRQDLGCANVAFMQDPDCRHVSERLCDGNIRGSKCANMVAEQVHGPNNLVAKLQGRGMNGLKTESERLRTELRPPVAFCFEVTNRYRLPGSEAVEAGAVACRQLKNFDEFRFFAGGGDKLEKAKLIDKQKPTGLSIENFGTFLDEPVKKIHNVEVVDEGIGQLDEGIAELRFSCFGTHRRLLSA
jgi:hypothetical protein